MKILYAIQGTGNGHLSRARDIVPLLQKNNELDILISGTQADVDLPYPIAHQLKGLGFIFGKKGGVDMWKTYLRTNSHRLQKEVKGLPVQKYDLIINDFEPVSAWACKLRDRPCIGLSHQAAVLLPNVPQPKKKDVFGHFILKNYAPSSKQYGFHFKSYGDNIFTPVIRQDVRRASIGNGDHYTVYLPSYSDEKILKTLSMIKNIKWEVFSKHHKKAITHKDITIRPITNETFIGSMANSRGILCGAGFETPAEALYMGKKLMVIPMKGQYEQQCNSAALSEMGVPVLKALKGKYINALNEWVEGNSRVEVHYPDLTASIISQLLEECV